MTWPALPPVKLEVPPRRDVFIDIDVQGGTARLDELDLTGGDVKGDILPDADSTYDIGSSSLAWAEGHFDALKIGGVDVAWQAWTPTTALLTVGNGTVVARYTQIGGTVIARFHLTFGSTTTIGTDPTITMPVTASSSGYAASIPLGVAHFGDSGTGGHNGEVVYGSSTTFKFRAEDVTGTYGLQAVITASIPMTWTTNDVLAFTAVYEAA